jgi:hypothetical protein
MMDQPAKGRVGSEGRHPAVFQPEQARFLTIPQTPLCYWLRDRFFELLAGRTLGDLADVCQGLATADDARFVRFVWEVPPEIWGRPVRERRWVSFEKGGGYGKWFGHHFWAVDWEQQGARIKAYPKSFVRNEQHYFKEGWTYSYMARGSLGLRVLDDGTIFSHLASAVFFKEVSTGLAAAANGRLSSLTVRSLSAKIQLNESYVSRIPIPENVGVNMASLEPACVLLKRCLTELDLVERTFKILNNMESALGHSVKAHVAEQEALATALHSLEGVMERECGMTAGLDELDLTSVLDETGTPAGWHPIIEGYDAAPPLPDGVIVPPELLGRALGGARISASASELVALKRRLRALYEAGPGASADDEEDQASVEDNDDEEAEEAAVSGARISIPAETFLEELSQKMEVHPVSIYWLLRELREKEGVVCGPDRRRFVEDYLTVMVLRLLGHRWPRQVEAGEPLPDWAEADGIIPLTEGTGEPVLIARVRARLAADFGPGNARAVEREFEEITGTPLAVWLGAGFFQRHVSQFRKRPIAWQIQSAGPAAGRGRASRRPPAFVCLVYAHRMDSGLLPRLRTQHVGPLRQRLELELADLERMGSRTGDQESRRAQLDETIGELGAFEELLESVSDRGFDCPALESIANSEPLDRWTSRDGRTTPTSTEGEFHSQERRYDPDLNDGVRVNIAPLQAAGLLAAPVLASRDLARAIADRAERRAEEREWCREGKLPRPGWWPEEPS